MKAHLFDNRGNYVQTMEVKEHERIIRLPKLSCSYDWLISHRPFRKDINETAIKPVPVIEFILFGQLMSGALLYEEKWYKRDGGIND